MAVVLSGLNLAFPFCESLLDLLDHALESLERLIQAFRRVPTILHSCLQVQRLLLLQSQLFLFLTTTHLMSMIPWGCLGVSIVCHDS